MTMHNITACPSTGYFITLYLVNCYTTVFQQCKCSLKFYYIYLISINMSNVIIVTIFELIIHAALI
jgi:hypothetical protein